MILRVVGTIEHIAFITVIQKSGVADKRRRKAVIAL